MEIDLMIELHELLCQQRFALPVARNVHHKIAEKATETMHKRALERAAINHANFSIYEIAKRAASQTHIERKD